MLKAILIHYRSLLYPNKTTESHTLPAWELYPYTKEYLSLLHSHGIDIYFLSYPNEQCIHDICSEAGLLLEEIIYIDNCDEGINVAKNMSLTSVALLSPYQKGSLMKADVAIESLEALDYDYMLQLLQRAQGLPLTITSSHRLTIRELTVEDITVLHAMYQDKDVTKYMDAMDKSLAVEQEKHKAYIEQVYSFYGYGLWGVFKKDTDELIGRCGIQNQVINGIEEIELAYLLGKEYWGQGYALECCRGVLKYVFEELDIHRIVAVIDIDNARSIRLAKKLEMTCEKNILYKQRNCHLYSIDLRKENLRRETARNTAFSYFSKNPDTSVYSRRYK